ncbi:MAG: hypothetical protein KAJ31_02110 [Deltaproteobacteria bacterium]|nr:hypothetical protein [Deltaproteobacteria bacterium]
MKLYGPAGDLEIHIKGVTVRREFVILNAEMGVWQNTILIDSSDIRLLVPIFFRFSVLLFIIKAYIRSIFGKDKNSNS